MSDAVFINVDGPETGWIGEGQSREAIGAGRKQAAHCAADGVALGAIRRCRAFARLLNKQLDGGRIRPRGGRRGVMEAARFDRHVVGGRKAVGDVKRQRACRLVAIAVGDFKGDLEILVVGALGIGECTGLHVGIAAVGADGQSEENLARFLAGCGVDGVAQIVRRGAIGQAFLVSHTVGIDVDPLEAGRIREADLLEAVSAGGEQAARSAADAVGGTFRRG